MARGVLLLALVFAGLLGAVPRSQSPPGGEAAVEFVDTSFENASPLWYDFAADGTPGNQAAAGSCTG